jgi:hypothetical protein
MLSHQALDLSLVEVLVLELFLIATAAQTAIIIVPGPIFGQDLLRRRIQVALVGDR